MKRDVVDVEVEGRVLRLSNLDKVLWPATGFTKSDLLRYYASIAPVLVPHLRSRPITMRRFPDGIGDGTWFQTDCRGRPPWMAHAPVPSTMVAGKVIDYCLVDDLPSLLWVANLGTVELHPLLGRAPAVEVPTALVVDLDPGVPAGLADCCRVALRVREVLEGLGLVAWAKSSGAKGLQLYVPLHTAVTYGDTKPFARALAAVLARGDPDHVVDTVPKHRRAGKVFIDWSQNDPTKSTVAAYSLRAQPRPTVSTPLTWAEVEAGAGGDPADVAALVASPEQALTRVAEHGDLFAPVLERRQVLAAAATPGRSGGGT